MIERIIVPCLPFGEVRSVWETDINGGDPGFYSIIDDDTKEAECRCP